ncbi:hypothetical protein [Naasia sp. SYSU D00948]|uniref:hypothetical protein n=1 Tax=Naasia sp. SYSU D00948 TaxID=2817379 RepID=UPI001B30242F|nr:hypothetical protein [Naasia sp. SYSU D00948]
MLLLAFARDVIYVESPPDGWDVAAVLASIVAALLAGVGAIIVARQTVWTKEAVKQAAKSLEEQQIARIEVGLPRHRLVYGGTYPGGRISGPEGTLGDDRFFHLPNDDDALVVVQLVGTVRNDGPGAVYLKPNPNSPPLGLLHIAEAGHADWDVDAAHELHVPSGSEESFLFAIQRTVREWVEITEGRASGAYRVDMVYAGPGDTDADVHHALVVRGSVLQQAHAKNIYVLNDVENFSLSVISEPARKIYWRSRAKQLQIPT